MKIRALLLASVAFVAVGATLWLSEDTASDFVPRADQQVAAEHDGAVDVLRRLRANIETGEVNEEDYVSLRKGALKRAQAMGNTKAAPDVSWIEMGPDNIGGRIRGILVEDDNTTVWTGGVSGGLWVSYDAANSWTQVTGFPNCMVTTIAKNGNGRYYVGTGSSYDGAGGNGGSGFRGRGVYTSTDGMNWEIMPDTDPGLLGGGDWTATEKIVADPNNADRVWWGGNAGFGYMDGATVFEGVASGLPGGVGDIAIAADGSYMLASTTAGRVYKSTNNTFLDFEELFGNGDGDLPQSGIGRARVAISRDDVNQAYALFATSGGSFGGMYHSGQAGSSDTWDNIWPTGVDNITPLPRPQGIYDLALGVKPGDPGLAFVGGIEYWKCGPSSQAEQAAFADDFPGSVFNVHADVHEVVFANNGDMYVGTDGGIYKSTDGGLTYTQSNRGLNITQFYGIAYSAGTAVMGGTQDNGSLVIRADGSQTSDLEAFEVLGGDGFDCAISQVTQIAQGSVFAMSQNGGLARFTEDGTGGQFFDDDIIDLLDADGDIGQFYSVCQLHENTEDPNSQQFVILVNPYEQTISDSTFEMNTASLNLPFDYVMQPGEELRFWEQLPRPELTVDEPITEDPNFFFLAPQALTDILIVCDTDSVEIGTEMIIESIEQIDSCTVFLDEIICVPIGFDTTFAEVPVFEYSELCDTSYFYAADTLFNVREQIRVTDPYTSLFAVGFIGTEGIWITREATNFTTTPDWWRVDNAPGGGGTKAIEFTPDGNHMFVAGWDGTVTRYSGFNNVWSEEDMALIEDEQIFDAPGGGVATGIGIDWNNPNHVVVSIGGYGVTSGGKVVETFNALDDNPNWSNAWVPNNDPIAPMPVYDVMIDYANPDIILAATELGVYATDNGGDDWEAVNLGMAPTADALACPVHAIKQQWRGTSQWSFPENTGIVYAGTHGRGIFRSENLVNVNEIGGDIDKDPSLMTIFPNPVVGEQLSVKLDLGLAQNVTVNIYTATGRLITTEQVGNLSGPQTIELSASGLSNGQYIMQIINGGQSEVAKFVVLK